MLKRNYWQAGSAVALAVGMASSAISPFSLPIAAVANPAPLTVAQLFPSQPNYPAPDRRVAIPAGTRLPVQYDQSQALTVAPTDTVPMTLVISKNIRNAAGDLLIPAWSEVKGRLRPVSGGSQFFAEELVLTDGSSLPINGTSPVIAANQQQQGVNTGSVLTGTAIGAAGATVLSGVTGKKRITLGKVLLGAGAGAIGGLLLGKKRTDVITINPNTQMELTLNSSLALR